MTTRNWWRVIELNRKKSSIEEAIKGYHLERDRHAVNAGKKKNRIIKDVSHSFKRAASEKETELEVVMAKRKCLENKRKKIS